MAGKKFKIPQASSKMITKQNVNKQSNKKQLNDLIKVLQPKVYITGSSNFKGLVQELTGNRGGSSSSSVPFPSSPRRTEAVLIENNNVPVIDITEDHGDKQASLDAYSFEFSHNVASRAEGFRVLDDQMYLNDESFDTRLMNQLVEDWLAYQDLDSWLLDVDQPCPSSLDGFGQNQGVSIYGYQVLM